MRPTLLALALVACSTVSLVHADEAKVRYDGKEIPRADLPASLPQSAHDTVAAWASWADENKYRLFLTDDGRVLLIVPLKNRSARKELALIEKTCEYIDEILPAPERETNDSSPEAGKEPEAPKPGYWSWRWGDDGPPLDSETAVLIQVRDQKDYGAALRNVVSQHEYLDDWLDTALGYSGFTLELPLCAVWLAGAKDLEEWDVRNELVHRLATLLVLRRFDQQPYWLLTGLAWHVEYELMDSHYCFPYRSEFVYTAEHTAWESMQKAAHDGSESLRMEQVTRLVRGEFYLEHARNAWGAASMLAKHYPESLALALEDLRLLRNDKGVSRTSGTWTRITGWNPTPEDQLAILHARFGEDFLDEVLAFYQKGTRYRARKRPDSGR